ncbi:TPA: GNAT family N-acetyltransferase [Raoultella ornithinolytica]|nr:GNAT family N-acetyltransferase [Raoultella ornithinolytica]
MDDFYSREITLADMPFLMHEFEEGARLGHFTNEIITPAGGEKFEKQTREAIKTRDAEGYSGHFIFILLRRSDDKKIGLIWFTPAIDPTGDPRLELRAVCITKSMQGKGYGSMLLSDMIDSNAQQPMMAKCYVKSTKMAEMLKRRGFHLVDTSPTGTQLLFRNPR